MASEWLSQDFEIDLLKRLLPFLSRRDFIDIGAERGLFAGVLLGLGLTGIMIEPMPKYLPQLRALQVAHPGTGLLTCAIAHEDAERDFFVATDESGQELDYFHSLVPTEGEKGFTHSKSFRVQCRSVHSLAQQGEVAVEVGILKTDTEGNDLYVLRGLGAMRPEVLVCEYFCPGVYQGWPDGAPGPMVAHMQALGYRHWLATKRVPNSELEFLELNPGAYAKSQWGNLFFFRDDFYEKASGTLSEAIRDSQVRGTALVADLWQQLTAKEAVIQTLVRERDSRSGTWWRRFF